jgi:glycosyltransferase involved in cell wall biosynthesis
MSALLIKFIMLFDKSPRDLDLFIAPYSPAKSKFPALGAAKKIRLVCHGFQKKKAQVVFFNTANNLEGTAYFQQESFFPDGVLGVNLIPNIKPRTLGRFFSIVIAPFMGLFLGAVVKPRSLWVYNLGAGELLMGYFAGLGARSKVLEVEDLPFSRKRGFGEIKPFLDQSVSWFLQDSYHTYFLVSHQVRRLLGLSSKRQFVVPGIISEIKIRRLHLENEPLKVGYFGGFEPEKGCNLLVELLKNRNRNWSYTVCGGGTHEAELATSLQLDLGDELFVNQSDEAMDLLQAHCKLLLNPHRPLREMGFGVFPFKVAEYMNSDSTIITTDLGIPFKDLYDLGLLVAEWRAEDFHFKINQAFTQPEWIDEDVLRRRGEVLRGLVNDEIVASAVGESVSNWDSFKII